MADTTYATPQDFRARYTRAGASNGDPDAVWQSYLNTGAQIVDTLTRGYKAGYEAFSESASETRYFDDRLSQNGALDMDDALTVSAITRGSVTITSGYYKLWPYNPGNGPYTRILFRADIQWPVEALIYPSSWYGWPYHNVGAGQVAITGTWGYCTEANRPAAVKEATLKVAKQLYDESSYTGKDMMQAVNNPAAWVDKSIMLLLQRAGLTRVSEGLALFG